MATLSLSRDDTVVRLPSGAPGSGTTLHAALRARRSTRNFLPDPLSLKEVSQLLWAAFGVNRPGSWGRTAPSAYNWQEIAIYAVLPQGTWRYAAGAHSLECVSSEDLRAATGTQDFVATAPLNLVYVADVDRMSQAREEEQGFLAGADAGCIVENVYLYCAAHGLGTVVRGLIDRQRLAQALGLKPTQRVVLAQTVGRCAPDTRH